MTPLSALHRYFAFPHFRPGQAEAINFLLAGRDTLVVMPTGSGKSLIYQLTAMLLSGVTLVVSPLVALMKDQADSLTRRSLPATFINSSLNSSEQSQRLRALANREYKIVLVAPERFRSRSFRETLTRVPLSLLVVDEAHCLSQWGHDFRPDYLRIAEARQEFKPPLTLALTATATPRVQDDIVKLLGLPRAEKLVMGFNRPNLSFEVFNAPSKNSKLDFVRDFLAQAEGAGIVYTGSRKDAEEVAAYAREVCKVNARHYHGLLDAATRNEVQDAFMAGDLPLVVATNAFGMGIDRPDVRFVLHHTMPGTLEAYYQEAGRAGRDGLLARAVLLYSPSDTRLHEHFIENDSASAQELRVVHNFLRGDSNADLAGTLREHPRGLAAPQESVKVVSFALADVERMTGLPQTKARVALELLETAKALRRAPDEFGGMIQVSVLPLADKALREVTKQVEARRTHKRKLLDLMISYAETSECRRRALLGYFGDHSKPAAEVCCDNCLARAETTAVGVTETRPAQTQAERAALIVLDTIAHLKWSIGKTKLAHVLKGKDSPEMELYQQARNYGKFIAFKISEIESLIDQLISAGYLKHVGGEYTTLHLTPRGEASLKARAAIRVDLRPVRASANQTQKTQSAASGTVQLTGEMLKKGLSPDEIAAERGLTIGTIYYHLSRLIAEGRVDIDQVVPRELQKQIRQAIEQIGAVEYLAPIKTILPPEVDYGQIRCVAEAWKREQK
jgi:ATP-dependent DNA helicase RecQ